jgi:hypothetical protein
LNRDLALIAALHESGELPREKKYLLKYFRTSVQQAFLRYVTVFGDYKNFCDHTGIVVQERWLKELQERHDKLERIKKQARESLDLTTLAQIESGEYHL